MRAVLGSKISLPTQLGSFEVTYVSVVDKQGAIVREGVALSKTSKEEQLIVRVQSSCLFSESFWATDCDCALQLRTSLQIIQQRGGLVLYFYEEGRGAGLRQKFKAIELQQVQSMDTQQAYECLSIAIDSRSYEAQAVALRQLIGDRPIVLLSNNEQKANGLADHGVNVLRRERLICGADNPAVRAYLLEKRRVMNHDIPDDQVGNG
jgi:GTP cyclohydrolase II